MRQFNCIQLASLSPRRAELLDQIGVSYKLVANHVAEYRVEGETPLAYVQRLSREKALDGERHLPYLPTLGADTIAVMNDEVLEKPKDIDDAKRMLSLMSANVHQVYTAVTLAYRGKVLQGYSKTDVKFRSISDGEIDQYWQTGEPCDKAGAYAIQGLGAMFVSRIEGSYSGVVGLPIEVLETLFKEMGVTCWNSNKL